MILVVLFEGRNRHYFVFLRMSAVCAAGVLVLLFQGRNREVLFSSSSQRHARAVHQTQQKYSENRIFGGDFTYWEKEGCSLSTGMCGQQSNDGGKRHNRLYTPFFDPRPRISTTPSEGSHPLRQISYMKKNVEKRSIDPRMLCCVSLYHSGLPLRLSVENSKSIEDHKRETVRSRHSHRRQQNESLQATSAAINKKKQAQ